MMSVVVKVTLIGDEKCGKKSLSSCFKHGEFSAMDVKTVFQHFNSDIEIEGLTAELAMWNIALQDGYEQFRALHFSKTDVFLLCFDLNSPESFQNVINKWKPEAHHIFPNIPIVLIGTKMDLRNSPRSSKNISNESQNQVTYLEGVEMGNKISAFKYLECSAKTKEGVLEAFAAATRATLLARSSSNTLCNIN